MVNDGYPSPKIVAFDDDSITLDGPLGGADAGDYLYRGIPDPPTPDQRRCHAVSPRTGRRCWDERGHEAGIWKWHVARFTREEPTGRPWWAFWRPKTYTGTGVEGWE